MTRLTLPQGTDAHVVLEPGWRAHIWVTSAAEARWTIAHFPKGRAGRVRHVGHFELSRTGQAVMRARPGKLRRVEPAHRALVERTMARLRRPVPSVVRTFSEAALGVAVPRMPDNPCR